MLTKILIEVNYIYFMILSFHFWESVFIFAVGIFVGLIVGYAYGKTKR